MSPVDVAAIYSSLLVILGIALQWRVILFRRSRRIGVGVGKDRDLERAVRVHGNYVENAGFGIAMLILLALTLAPVIIMHGVGVMMLVGRLAHAQGLSQSEGASLGRVAGMILSQTSLAVAALTLIVRAIF
jgi:hypothetical protein